MISLPTSFVGLAWRTALIVAAKMGCENVVSNRVYEAGWIVYHDRSP